MWCISKAVCISKAMRIKTNHMVVWVSCVSHNHSYATTAVCERLNERIKWSEICISQKIPVNIHETRTHTDIQIPIAKYSSMCPLYVCVCVCGLCILCARNQNHTQLLMVTTRPKWTKYIYIYIWNIRTYVKSQHTARQSTSSTVKEIKSHFCVFYCCFSAGLDPHSYLCTCPLI